MLCRAGLAVVIIPEIPKRMHLSDDATSHFLEFLEFMELRSLEFFQTKKDGPSARLFLYVNQTNL